MKKLLAVLVGWNVLTTALAIVNCVCNDQTVPTTYSPVCANDGMTYRNAQMVACMNQCYSRNLRILSYGVCGAPAAATTTTTTRRPGFIPGYQPYPPTSVNIVNVGNRPGNVCVCTNTNYDAPVCGSDGMTYRNPKIVQCLNICQRRNIHIVAYQACPTYGFG